VAVAKGIADLVEQEHLHSNYILPPIEDQRILATVSDKLILCISSQIRLIVGGSPLMVSSKRFESSR
jgi:hypothetical protein